MKKPILSLLLLIMQFIPALCVPSINSIQTDLTITNVRNARFNNKSVIIGGSYEGVIVCYDYEGHKLWQNNLSGYLNSDIFCGDLNGDGNDEILTANADGNIYCLDSNGKLLWKFYKNNAPMNSVCIFHKAKIPYIACGGYDMNLYYLSANGKELNSIPSSEYSKEQGFGKGGLPKGEYRHVANFIRPLKQSDGSEVIVLHGVINSMSALGGMYFFEPLATKPFKYAVSSTAKSVYGSMSIDELGDYDKLMLGSSKDTHGGFISEYDIKTGKYKVFSIDKIAKNKLSGFGYRVVQCQTINIDGKKKYFILFGSNIIIADSQNNINTAKVLTCKYSFYDLIKDNTGSKLILASAQSGGSCIHIIDLKNKDWENAYENLVPKGKISSILDNTSIIRKQVDKFKLPKWETLNRPVVTLMSENPNKNPFVKEIADEISSRYPSPIFLNGGNSGGSENPLTWNRDTLSNDFYRDRRDRRQKYNNTQENVLKNVAKAYVGDSKGMSMWGGHGNDPFYYSLDTDKKILSQTKKGQQTVLIYPEMEGLGKDMEWLMNNLLYPLASTAREYNSKLYIRSKHIFWLGNIYENYWSRLVSGEFADVFVPSMEETSDKSMELSLSGRLGMWMSGAVNSWGSRCARDNASYNRLRQFSHQNLPSNFLRNMVYYISYGSQYIDNFPVDQQYMSLLWEMIAKGILYVPSRDQIVSINPVRLTMLQPDSLWLDEGNNVKWVCFYNKEKEDSIPYVMGHLNGSWPAAPTTEWDFSKYAAGAKERRLNFISSFNNGMVLIAPPFDSKAPRGEIESHMNPIYKGKLKEFYTDGRFYYSDRAKSKKYSPIEYYKIVETAIENGAKELPLTVKGEVGWVVAQSAPTHLRLTMIDGGYVNPSDKNVIVNIGTAKVKSVKNLLTGELIKFSNKQFNVTVPCGMFTFLDVELSEPLVK